MKIPMPFDHITSVVWFQWSNGLEYTYSTPKGLVCVKEALLQNETKCLILPDHYLTDGPFRDKGIPLRGTGYVDGLVLKKEKTYADIIISSRYFTHVKIELGKDSLYENGEIVFPPVPSMETEEQKRRIATSSYWERKTED